MDKLTEQKELFKSIISKEWNGKAIWEHIRDNELSSAPAFKGEYYDAANTKIMFVGRALNGWETDFKDCSTIDATVDSVFDQKDSLDTLICKEGFEGKNASRRYYHKNQKFWRFIKAVLEELDESEKDTDKTWYEDKKHWNQKFVWANLYCISKKFPESSAEANPAGAMIKPSISEYVDLMQSYIIQYEPDAALFITDINGWFIKWTKQKSFKCMLDESTYEPLGHENFIVAKGYVGKTLVLVCKRPDGKWSYTFDDVKKMAKEVADVIKRR